MTVGSGYGVVGAWVGYETGQVVGDDQLDDAERADAALFASDILFSLTNRHWPGVARRVVRPRMFCRRRDVCTGRQWWWGWPGTPGWELAGWAPGQAGLPCGDPCDHSTPTVVLRVPGPVASVNAVTVDGADLPAGAYLVQGRSTIIRIDGGAWPTSNTIDRLPADPPPAGSTVPAWEIDYQWGALPPASGVLACRALYREVALGLLGAEECRLMWGGRLTNVNRRGVSLTFESIAAALQEGLTGIDEVDAWIIAARGGRWRPRAARVVNADRRPKAPLWAT